MRGRCRNFHCETQSEGILSLTISRKLFPAGSITLIWVPGHRDMYENKAVDKLARYGTRVPSSGKLKEELPKFTTQKLSRAGALDNRMILPVRSRIPATQIKLDPG